MSELASVTLQSTTVTYSGDRFSGNDGFSGTKNPDDAILFTVSGITVLVELFLENFGTFCQFSYIFMQKVMIYEKNMTKSVKTQEKSQTQGEKSWMNVFQLIKNFENEKLISIDNPKTDIHKLIFTNIHGIRTTT